MRKLLALALLCPSFSFAQLKWTNVDSAFGSLPSSLKVYFTNSVYDTAPFRAYYVITDLKDRNLNFTTDTTHRRRLTPSEFFEKNARPLLVVNGTFFSFETNANLNVVVKEGKTVSYNSKTVKSLSDSATRLALYSGAIGISRKRKPDVAWAKTDSVQKIVWASQVVVDPQKAKGNYYTVRRTGAHDQFGQPSSGMPANPSLFKKWNVWTAIGGGPVLVQNGNIEITNNEEKMFAGKAINDKHPRTAMGYTRDKKLIVLIIEGRNPLASGATLTQEAQILKDLGCVEALNLDGGGSSCLLINGKETITPSDKKQRAVPAVFIIQSR